MNIQTSTNQLHMILSRKTELRSGLFRIKVPAMLAWWVFLNAEKSTYLSSFMRRPEIGDYPLQL